MFLFYIYFSIWIVGFKLDVVSKGRSVGIYEHVKNIYLSQSYLRGTRETKLPLNRVRYVLILITDLPQTGESWYGSIEIQ